MEDALKTPQKTSNGSENSIFDTKTPIQNRKSQSSGKDPLLTGITPDRLKVPTAVRYPERYTSPTDLMVSPISKDLLARNRKPGFLLPPTKIQPKIQDMGFKEVGLSQT